MDTTSEYLGPHAGRGGHDSRVGRRQGDCARGGHPHQLNTGTWLGTSGDRFNLMEGLCTSQGLLCLSCTIQDSLVLLRRVLLGQLMDT